MAISFLTDDAAKLLTSIKKKIDDGEIATWSYDDAGDFTHTPEQWKYRAWLKATEASHRLRFHIVGSTRYNLTWTIYSVYHGRFLETVIRHCRDLYTVARSQSKPTGDDTKPTGD